AVSRALGEIVIFSDANTLFGRDAVARIVENFADPEVGYLTGALRFTAEDDTISGAGVDAYMRYENFLREVETRAGSIIGVNGGVDAIRKSLYVDIPPHLITDFVLPLSVIAAGRRVVFDPRVTAVEAPNTEIGSEFRMRVRVALRAMQGLSYMRRLLNPFRYPLAAFCLVSHKVLRYGGFAFMLGALFANMALALHSDGYVWLLVLQLACYALALAGLAGQLPGWLKKVGLVPGYLLMSNAAFAFATVRYLRGDTMAVWKPRAG
ncbi:glycosyltransferase family 2 protein, partial [Oxalobacteraceae bacterium OM1]